jgi:HK97 gp10 family phage protein
VRAKDSAEKEVKAMAKLNSNLAGVRKAAIAAAEAARTETAAGILNAMLPNVPVDTGLLKSSYIAEEDGDISRVGTDTSYAPWVEFGTSRMAAQPHLVPAFASQETGFQIHWEARLKAGMVGGAILSVDPRF